MVVVLVVILVVQEVLVVRHQVVMLDVAVIHKMELYQVAQVAAVAAAQV